MEDIAPLSQSQHTPSDPNQSPSWMRHVRRVGLLTFLSRIFGLIRDMGMAATFGNGPLLDAFTLAFRIPNMSRRLFGEGALTTAFLPRYVVALEEDKSKAEQLASAVLFILIVTLSLVTLLGYIVLGLFYQTNLLGESSRLLLVMAGALLPYVLLICVTAQLCAMLHAQGYFSIPATVPILLNFIWILAIWFITPYYTDPQTQVYIVIGAILLGGGLQLLLPAMHLYLQGFRVRWKTREQFREARKVFRDMLPIVFGLSITQVNSICDGTLAWWFALPEQGSWITPGSASALYYGQRMYQFPLGIFGIALGTVLFARLIHHVKTNQLDSVKQDVQFGLSFVLIIGLPASAGMMLLAYPIAETLLERGQFDAFDTQQTTQTIIAYGTAIWSYLGITLLQRVFYAMGDVKTPLRIGLATVALNLLLNIPLMIWLGGKGLAYATAIAAVVQFIYLWAVLKRHLPISFSSANMKLLSKLIASSLVMSLAIWLLLQWLPDTELKRWQAVQLLFLISVAVVVYGFSLKILQVEELNEILGFSKKPTILTQQEDLDANRKNP